MANKTLSLNPGRQYPLVLAQAFTFEIVTDAGVPVKVASLPRGAVVLSGNLVVTTGFGASAKIKLGFAGADAAHGDIDVAATGSKPLTVSGIAGDKTDLIATPNAAMAAGAATLYVTYVIAGRANEAQP